MTIAIVVAVAVLALVAFIASRPNTFRLERSILIATAPDKPFMLVNDFHNWNRWSPFDNVDADLKRTYGGSERGVGATYGWDGKKTGVGRMEILESTPSAHILIKLDFSKPFEAHNRAVFTFAPEAGGTRATWTMTGPMAFINKAMSLFASMEKIVGGEFEKGLEAMKAEAEKM